MRSVKVAHLITGSERSHFLNDHAKYLRGSSIRLCVGSLSPGGRLQEDIETAETQAFSLGATRRASFVSKVVPFARWLRRNQVDLVHTHLLEASLVGLLAARLARLPSTMTRHHSNLMALSGSRRGLLADRVVGSLPDRIIAPSQAVANALMEIDRVHPSRIVRLPYGFDWSRIKAQRGRMETRAEFSARQDFLMVAVGRLDRMKGFGSLISTLAEMDWSVPWRLLIVGEGPERANLETQILQRGVQGRVSLLGHRTDAYDLMASADVVVHPSLSEAQNQVIIEALALECPVIATDVGAASEAVIDGTSGWLIPLHNGEALAGALRSAAADSPRARAYGRSGRELVRELYSMERLREGYCGLYSELLKGRAH